MTIKSRINKIRNYNYQRLKRELIFYLKIGLIVGIILLFVFGVFRITFLIDNSIVNSLLWTILNAIGYGGLFVSYGFFCYGIQAKNIRLYLLIIILTIFITGIGIWNVKFEFNLFFLFYRQFSLSTADGLYFILGNFHIFGLIYLISFSLESERL